MRTFAKISTGESSATGGLGKGIFTPYNVGSVLWRLFSTLEVFSTSGG